MYYSDLVSTISGITPQVLIIYLPDKHPLSDNNSETMVIDRLKVGLDVSSDR